MDNALSTRRQRMAFPVIGQIRKGALKGEMVKNGKTIKTVGQDLRDKFRVVMFAGNNGADTRFMQVYGTMQPTRIQCMLPFATIDQSWQYFNEAYSAGRMIARADDEHYITLRDPKTGVYTVINGEPFTPFVAGTKIEYEVNGSTIKLPVKPTGRLRVWLPALERMVMLELKTTSFYDCLNIDSQLGAMAAMAETLNNRSVAGIPFWLYRRPTEITWNKPDGSATRVEKWLINLEVDSDWVKVAFSRLRSTVFGLSGGDSQLTLPQPTEESAQFYDVDPETDGAEDEEHIPDEVIQAGALVLGNTTMASMTNDQLMLLSDKGSKAADHIKAAAALIINWRIEHGDNS